MTYTRLITILLISLITATAWAIDMGNESMADKADRFDFEEFHKEKGITLWEEKKAKTATTYEEDRKTTEPAPVASNPPQKKSDTFKKGDELKVREAYKLGDDPALRNVPGLYDATEALHKQLNGYCPKGWAKDSEWHKPEQNYFYMHYSAICL